MYNIIDTHNMSYVTRKLINNLQIENLKYDIEDSMRTFERFNKVFEVISQVQTGDKLGIVIKEQFMEDFASLCNGKKYTTNSHNGCGVGDNTEKAGTKKTSGSHSILDYIEYVYIDNCSTLQKWKRWYYNENRNKTMCFLKNVFDEYDIFITMVLNAMKNDTLNKCFKKLAVKCSLWIESLQEPLSRIKDTYTDCEKMSNIVQQILFILDDCETRINAEL